MLYLQYYIKFIIVTKITLYFFALSSQVKIILYFLRQLICSLVSLCSRASSDAPNYLNIFVFFLSGLSHMSSLLENNGRQTCAKSGLSKGLNVVKITISQNKKLVFKKIYLQLQKHCPRMFSHFNFIYNTNMLFLRCTCSRGF